MDTSGWRINRKDPESKTWNDVKRSLTYREFIPATIIEDIVGKYEVKPADLESLDLSGLDGLTDLALLNGNLASFTSLHKVSLAGCIHLTDTGITELSKCTNLSKLSLDGCYNVTERSIYILIQKCPILSEVSLIATGVSTIPLKHSINLHLNGCPLIRPLVEKDKELDLKPFMHHYLPIMGLPSVSENITEFLVTGKLQPRKEKETFSYKEGIKFGHLELDLNVMEIHSEVSLQGPFFQSNTVHIVVVDLDKIDNPQLHVMNRVNAISGQTRSAGVIVLLEHGEDSASESQARIAQLAPEIERYMEIQRKELLSMTKEDVKTKKFASQIQTCRARESCEDVPSFSLFRINKDTAEVEKCWPNKKENIDQLMEKKRSLQQEGEKILNEFAPILLQAIESLNKMNKSDISELKSFSSPPPLVKLSLECMCIMFGVDPSGSNYKRLLSDFRLTQNMISFDKDSISALQIKKLKRYMDNEDLTPEKLERVSRACRYFHQWVTAMYKYATEVSPRLKLIQAELSSVQESLKVEDNKEVKEVEDILRFQSWHHLLREAIQENAYTITERDIAELRSAEKLDDVQETILEAAYIVMDLEPGDKEGLLTDDLVSRLQNKEKAEVSQEKIDRIGEIMAKPSWSLTKAESMGNLASSVISGLYHYVVAVYHHASNIKPNLKTARSKLARIQAENNPQQQHKDGNSKSKDVSLIHDEIKMMYQKCAASYDNKMYSTQFFEVMNTLKDLKSEKLCHLAQLRDKLKGTLPAWFTEVSLIKILHKLQQMGFILHFPDVRGQPIVTNIEWFAECLNRLVHRSVRAEDNNGLRVKAVSPLVYRLRLSEELSHVASPAQICSLEEILVKEGLLLVAPPTYPANQALLERDTFLLVEQSYKTFLRHHALGGQGTGLKFTNEYWPNRGTEKFNKDDIEMVVHYELFGGMPASMLANLFTEMFALGQVINVWSYGLIARHGLVEIIVRNNVHATMLFNSIDLKVRTTLTAMKGHEGWHVTKQNTWSVLSNYMRVVDHYIHQHQHMSVKMSYTCPGECFSTGVSHSFSEAEIQTGKTECPKCQTLPSNNNYSDFLTGRMYPLPFHDYQEDSEEAGHKVSQSVYAYLDQNAHPKSLRWRCSHCRISGAGTRRQWAMEAVLNPTMAAGTVQVIQPGAVEVGMLDGNIATLHYQKDNPFKAAFMIKEVLYLTGMEEIKLTMLTRGTVQLVIGNEALFTSRDILKPVVDMGEQACSIFDLHTGRFTSIDGNSRTEEQCEAIKPGDTLCCTVADEKTVENKKQQSHGALETVFKKNGKEILRFDVRFRSHIGFVMSGDEDNIDVAPPRVILQCPSYPAVHSHHFPIGSSLLYKTEIGSQWALGRVFSRTLDGRLVVGPGESEDGRVTLPPDSENLLPVHAYATGLTVILDKEIITGQQQLKKYLKEHNSYPASYGLFPRLVGKQYQFTWLNLRNLEPKVCTVNVNSPQVLEAAYEHYMGCEGKSVSLNTSHPPFIILPAQISDKDLMNPFRQRVHDWNSQARYIICKGTGWVEAGKYARDMHLLNLAPENHPVGDGRFLDYLNDLLHHYHLITRSENFLTTWKEVLPDLVNQSEQNLKGDPQVVMHMLREYMQIYKATLLVLKAIIREWEYSGKKAKPRKVKGSKVHREIFQAYRQNSTQETEPLDNAGPLYGKFFDTCQTHDLLRKKINLTTLTLDTASPSLAYRFCITYLTVMNQPLKANFSTILRTLPHLEGLKLSACMLDSLQHLGLCRNLCHLQLPDNDIRDIHPDILQLGDTLETLDLKGNPIHQLPDFIIKLRYLRTLVLSGTFITHLPDDIGCLSRLRKLDCNETLISSLPHSFHKLRVLDSLVLTGIPWPPHRQKANDILTLPQWNQWCSKVLSDKERQEMFEASDVDEDGVLNYDEIAILQQKIFHRFPRIGRDAPVDDKYGGVPPQIFSCRSLKVLCLSFQAIKFVPDHVKGLRKISKFVISNNPNLESIDGQLGKNNLHVISIEGCPNLRTPPKEIVADGMKTVIAYLKRLSQGAVACSRTKLMFVGLGGAGKTSLMRALMSPAFKTSAISGEGITDGIDISMWTINKANQAATVTYSVWDFAGQTIYYNTHQFFLSNRAVYLLVWNTRLGYEHSGLEFWLSSITCHCPKAPIFVVGTHADQITKAEIPMEALQKRFSNIVGFATVSSATGQGVERLLDDLINTTLRQPYVGEMIPEALLNFERFILSKRNEASLLTWKEVSTMAQKAGIYGPEINQSVHFLHDLGTLQHFDNELLRDRVVVNPQWIVDVMACVVSVHNQVIQDGRLHHKDIGAIWKKYPKALHEWLLRLTEVFDLTFPLSDQPVNVVPCLLPQTEPQYEWPDLEGDNYNMKMVYRFDYLPTGLFNRAQVRLYQFSDDSLLWKTGSVLKKNGHTAVVKQSKDSEVLVHVRGARPENVLLLIHEVYEGLISDFFQGVKYEYYMPCVDCMKKEVKEPTMFSSLILRRAIEMKALFLQCHTFFHTLSMTDVQSNMLPQSSTDYDLQLQRTVRDLDSLGKDFSTDTFFMYCPANIPKDDSKLISPKQILADLEKDGFKCWFDDNIASKSVEELAVAIKNSKVVLMLISDAFVVDEHCQRMFQFASDVLNKEIVLLMVGEGREWQKSDIGMQVAEKVFINFQRAELYQDKLKALTTQLRQRITVEKHGSLPDAEVFLSYCWMNSASAVEAGHARPTEGAQGDGDPRQLKTYLENHGFPCWMDVERTGRVGLFEDIAEGMKMAKVVVACVSDEYSLSTNCQMEFRFAHVALRKPIILAVVGTGFRWESTEVGMLSLGYPKINFQVANNMAHDELLEHVQEVVMAAKQRDLDLARPITPSQTSRKEMAFQELYELAQRKFLRQLATYTEAMEPFPRLFVADLNYDANSAETEKDDAELDDIAVSVDKASKPSLHVEDLRSGQFCMKLLCEHEGGWHAVTEGTSVQLAGRALANLWKLSGPYMARIMAILKHSNINLPILNTPDGAKLLKVIEKEAGIGLVDMRNVYLELRKYMIRKDMKITDPAKTKGTLKRCHMPSGKILWLCKEHQQLPRVTVLSSEYADSGSDAEDQLNLPSPDNLLLSSLRAVSDHGSKQLNNTKNDDASKVSVRRRSTSNLLRPKSSGSGSNPHEDKIILDTNTEINKEISEESKPKELKRRSTTQPMVTEQNRHILAGQAAAGVNIAKSSSKACIIL